MQVMRVRLNDVILDLDAGTLTRDGAIVGLRPKSYMLLRYLVEHAGQVIGKDDLIAAVWPDVFVTDDSLTQTIRDVRTALHDEGARLVQTVRGRGYLLDLPDARLDGQRADATTRVPRLAILPFASASGEADLNLRLAMLREDAAAGLARFRTLNVISTASAQSAAAESRDPATVAALLDADYLVDGTALPAPGGFHLRLSMVNAAARTMVWSDTFDCTGEALLDASGAIVSRIVGRLLAGFELDATAQALTRPTGSLTAYDHFAHGYMLWASDAPDVVERAMAHFRAATEADPNFAMAWTYLAWAEVAAHDYALAPPEVIARAIERARTAVTLAPNEARAASGLGYIQALKGEYDAAEANIRRGLSLNPASVESLMDFAVVNIARGRPLEALRALEQVSDLNPMRVGPTPYLRGEALFMLGRYSEGADAFFQTTDLPARRRAILAAFLAKAGRADEAVAQIALAAQEDPKLGFLEAARRSYRYERAADNDHLAEALSLARDLWQAAGSPGAASG